MCRIGVDESGSGSLSGPMMCAAVASSLGPADWPQGLRDSKKMTDRARRAAVPALKERVLAWAVVGVPVEAIRALGHQSAWVAGMHKAVKLVHTALEDARRVEARVVVDGRRDHALAAGIHQLFPHRWSFEVDADDTYPEVSAASVLAKTYRNDCMVQLSKVFPAYGWEQNSGYGTRDHKSAILEHGLSAQHRPFKGDDKFTASHCPPLKTYLPTALYVAGCSTAALAGDGDGGP